MFNLSSLDTQPILWETTTTERRGTLDNAAKQLTEQLGKNVLMTGSQLALRQLDEAHKKQPYVREEDLNIQISDLLKPFSLQAVWADEMLTRVKGEKKQSAQTAKLMAAQKCVEIEKINLRLQKLLESFLDEVIDRETYVAAKAKEMSQKKSLEEQSTALLKGQADWLEPFQSWTITARNAGETVINGSLQQKRVLAK